MEIKVCHCRQCRAVKKGKRGNCKKRVRRLISKKRRKAKEGEVFNYYWA